MRPFVSYLEHLLIQPRDRIARQYVSAALTGRVPGDGGAGLGLLWHASIVTKWGAIRCVQHQDGTSVSACVRHGHKDQGLANLPVGRLWVSVLSDVVVLCVLYALALATLAVLAAVAHDFDFVACFRHIQATTRTAGLGQRKDRLRV